MINKLKNYFENRQDIAFAFLYGFYAKGTENTLSDIDIAVYFYPKTRHPIECESNIFYEEENKIRLIKFITFIEE